MSHVVTVKLEIKDTAAIEAAAERVAKVSLVNGTQVQDYKVYGNNVRGIGMQLEGWHHPVVIIPETGEVKYDNYGGHWGAQICLDEFVQAYSIEKAKNEALMHGHVVEEELLENGDVKLKIHDYA